jgi:histidinol dehydrogenase
VGIDSLAGPSEVVIVAGGVDTADEAEVDRLVDRIAADLLAQAEHDPRAAAVLVTDSGELAKAVARRVGERLDGLATAETAAASVRAFGGAFVVESMDEAAALVERLAPEHLQLVGPAAEALAGRRPPLPAGAIFVGDDTPEVFGDYVAGPSHVLPTCGTARFASALGVEDFVRRSHLVRVTAEAARELAPVAEALARAEGLPAHAASASLRRDST